jgi:myo-inositol-1(or 4)-monophosphatase
MPPSLNEIQNLARSAGKILRDGYGLEHTIQHKGLTDLVTEIDHRSEDLIIQTIRQSYPGDHIVTEESGILPGNIDHAWFIDPLDGTLNYAHSLPLFCVSLAYAEAQEVVLGVVYDPMRDECFSAERGKGAWLNGQPIQVSTTADLIHSLLATGFPYDQWEGPLNNLDFFNRFSLRTQGVRRLGSAALDLCYVASGRLEGFWEVSLKAWDIAAGSLIVQEAGGVVSQLFGAPHSLVPPNSIMAANPVIYPLMLDVIRIP